VLRAAEFRHGHSSLSRFLTPDLSVQPGLGRLPLPINGPWRHAHHFRRFLHGEPAEETQLHHPALLRVYLFQLRQRLIYGEQVYVALGCNRHCLVERNAMLATTSLESAAAASMANQNPPHHLRSNAEELRPVLPFHSVLVNQSEINLVHQRGRLKRVTGALPAEKSYGLTVQFFIYDRQQARFAAGLRVSGKGPFLWKQSSRSSFRFSPCRCEAVNAMLLNEFLKEHRTVEDLKATAANQQTTIERQQKQIEALTTELQKVTAEVETLHAPERVAIDK
jgi:hypothetical protein